MGECCVGFWGLTDCAREPSVLVTWRDIIDGASGPEVGVCAVPVCERHADVSVRSIQAGQAYELVAFDELPQLRAEAGYPVWLLQREPRDRVA